MKMDKRLKIAIIILIIIFMAIISFAGLYVQKNTSIVNVLADYKLGMDLKGSRVIKTATKSEEGLTTENYLKTKEIVEKRLKDFKLSEYLIRLDEKNGGLTVQIPDDDNADTVAQYVYAIGKFTIVGDNDEILLDGTNVKSVKSGYMTSDTGTTVALNIEFNKDSWEKLKEISNTYVKSTDEEGNDNSKKVTLKIDGSELISTGFESEISNGIISISVGQSTNDTESIREYLKEANNVAVLLRNGEFPIEYSLEQNKYVASDITEQNITMLALIFAGIVVVSIVVLGIFYKKNGIILGIANIGYLALLLILIRYTNVIITIEGIIGIVISFILNYIFNIFLLNLVKDENVKKAFNKSILKMLWVLIPVIIIDITLCFTGWMPIYSFGEIIFWGILTIFIYNTIITRTLLIYSKDDE